MIIENLQIKDNRLPAVMKCPCCKEVIKLYQPMSTPADSRSDEFIYMVIKRDKTAADSD